MSKFDKYGRIRKYLNRQHSGRSTFKGKTFSLDSKQKISESKKRYYQTHESYWTGKHISKEVIQKQIQTRKLRYRQENHPFYGKHLSNEHRRKLSIAKTKIERPIIIRNGYRYLFKPTHPNADCDGRVAEHVYLMTEHIGRSLAKNEHIHHLNHNRSDNRLENLKILTNSDHMQTHRLEQEIRKNKQDRICVNCNTKTPEIVQRLNKDGILTETFDWRKNPFDKSQYVCRRCYRYLRRKIKYK